MSSSSSTRMSFKMSLSSLALPLPFDFGDRCSAWSLPSTRDRLGLDGLGWLSSFSSSLSTIVLRLAMRSVRECGTRTRRVKGVACRLSATNVNKAKYRLSLPRREKKEGRSKAAAESTALVSSRLVSPFLHHFSSIFWGAPAPLLHALFFIIVYLNGLSRWSTQFCYKHTKLGLRSIPAASPV